MYVPVPARVHYNTLSEEHAPPLAHPDCPGRGITFVLFQKTTDSNVGYRVTRQISGAAKCTETGDWIPAMAWTRDMERAFRLARETAPRQRPSYRFHRRFLVVTATTVVVLALALASLWRFVLSSPNTYQKAQARIEAVAASPSPGDLLLATLPGGSERSTWFVIREVTPEAIGLQAYNETSPSGYALPDLDRERFTETVLHIPPEEFLSDGLLGGGITRLVLNAVPADD